MKTLAISANSKIYNFSIALCITLKYIRERDSVCTLYYLVTWIIFDNYIFSKLYVWILLYCIFMTSPLYIHVYSVPASAFIFCIVLCNIVEIYYMHLKWYWLYNILYTTHKFCHNFTGKLHREFISTVIYSCIESTR